MHRRCFISLSARLATRLAACLTAGPALLGLPAFAARASSLFQSKSFQVVGVYPHDPEAFTQGLLFHDGYFYESTGGWGRSSLRQVEPRTGRVLRRHDLPRRYFGEGLALWENRLIQLTWKAQTGLVYDLQSFELVKTFSYSGQGWGLTHDEQGLIMSNGSNVLRRLDARTFREMGRIEVMDRERPVPRLNELEYVDGMIWANIYPTSEMVCIDPAGGSVVSRLDLAGILGPRRVSRDAVANGIAHDATKDRLFVTGKLWPVLFEIHIQPKQKEAGDA
jgi:glutaminyl-peptide cyclotransferase